MKGSKKKDNKKISKLHLERSTVYANARRFDGCNAVWEISHRSIYWSRSPKLICIHSNSQTGHGFQKCISVYADLCRWVEIYAKSKKAVDIRDIALLCALCPVFHCRFLPLIHNIQADSVASSVTQPI